LVQAFLKKWWVESDFKAPNLPLSLWLKDSGCQHFAGRHDDKGGHITQLDKNHISPFLICRCVSMEWRLGVHTNVKLKPLISSLLWNLHHENISFRSKVIPINVLENTCPGFKPSPSKIDKQHTCTLL
jgi:hypothetical protein